jgi:hypothetical protein
MHYHLIREALTDVILFLLFILYGYVRITRGKYLPRNISTVQIGWRQPSAQGTAQRHFVSGTGIFTYGIGTDNQVYHRTVAWEELLGANVRYDDVGTLELCLSQGKGVAQTTNAPNVMWRCAKGTDDGECFNNRPRFLIISSLPVQRPTFTLKVSPVTTLVPTRLGPPLPDPQLSQSSPTQHPCATFRAYLAEICYSARLH